MKKDTVKEISFNDDDSHVDVLLLNLGYCVTLPKSSIMKKTKDKQTVTLLKPGDKFITLYDNHNIEVAYIYNHHLHLHCMPWYPDVFMQSLPLCDRFVMACALRREMWHRGKIPHLAAYKNLSKFVQKCASAEYRLSH